MDVVAATLEEDYALFSDCDLLEEMERLLQMAMPSERRCTLTEYLEGDNDLQVCMEVGSEDWEEDFFQQLRGKDEEPDNDSEDDDIDDDDEDMIEMDLEPPSPKVKTFKEAVEALEEVSKFLENRGYVQAHSMLGSVIDEVAGLKATTS